MPHCSHWEWLEKVRSQGVHLPKSVLVNHAISDSSFLRFICDTTLKTISVSKIYIVIYLKNNIFYYRYNY